MTSRRLFFNAMKEDLRHKIWMIALFTLISFLAVPMVWLLMRSNISVEWQYVDYNEQEVKRYIDQMMDFFMSYLISMGGIFAIMAGLVSGLSGFRYLFHKNRVDTYHSLPIKRRMLYGVCYVDGILVWFVPFTICIVLTAVFAGGFLGRLGGTAVVARMSALTGQDLLVILTIFLLVYHLVLVAVMMSGNILNTLVNILLLGGGAAILSVMWRAFFQQYMLTFYDYSFLDDMLIYASPLFDAIYLLCSVYELEGTWNLWLTIFANMLFAAVLGTGAWIMYQRRNSELAEQGVCNRVVTGILRVAAGVMAGMTGWVLFLLITDNMGGAVGIAWKSFGGILVCVFVFGVLDVIFHMEFGAFFLHKFQMVGTVILTLLICFAFHEDWFGYDTYLPEKEEIEYMAVFDRQFSNFNGGYNEASANALEHMQFQDMDIIYDFLKSAVDVAARDGKTDKNVGYENIDTKITLKNGKSYYRSYIVPARKEILWPLLTSREYLETAYLIDDEETKHLKKIVLYREGKQLSAENPELVSEIVKAYRQDMLEHSDEMLSGEGKTLARVWLEGVERKNNSAYWRKYVLNIDSCMEHVVEVLERAGYREWVQPREASTISAIWLKLYMELDGSETKEDLIARAMKVYGVEETERNQTDYIEIEEGASVKTDYEIDTMVQLSGTGNSPMLQITDKEEIEELLSWISYVETNNSSKLRRQQVKVSLVDLQGNMYDCYIPKGVLPMKYIIRFGEIAETKGVQK